MTRRPEVPRAGSALANVAAVLALAVMAVAVPYVVSNWAEISGGLQDQVAAIPELQAEREQAVAAGSESLLLLALDDAGRIGSAALVANAADQSSIITVIPTTLFDLLPGYGDFALADATSFEGPELAHVAVSNALGVRIDRTAVIEFGVLASIRSLELAIDLGEPVIDESSSTAIQIGEPGMAIYPTEVVQHLLTTRFDSSAVGWLNRQASVWSVLLNAMEVQPTLPAQLIGDGTSAAVLGRAAADSPVISVIPVTPVAVAGADDGFQLVQVDVAAFVADRLTHLALAAGERPRVEVLNGNGEILATRSVVDALVANGFHVVKTDNAENFEFEETVVISQGRDNRDAAARAAAELGVATVQLEVVAPSGVVDVSIIVGQDIATLRS